MVRRGCERGTKTTSGASIPSKKFSCTQDYLDMRRVPQGKGQETGAEMVGSTYWVITAKSEAKAVCLIHVEWICIQDANVHFPLLEVRGRYEVNPWGKGLLNLRFGKSRPVQRGGGVRELPWRVPRGKVSSEKTREWQRGGSSLSPNVY